MHLELLSFLYMTQGWSQFVNHPLDKLVYENSWKLSWWILTLQRDCWHYTQCHTTSTMTTKLRKNKFHISAFNYIQFLLLAFHTINLRVLHILTCFIKLFSELTSHLFEMLKGSLSMSLYRLCSSNLLTMFGFSHFLDWCKTRLTIMERCLFPLIFAGILHIIGTILRQN